MVHNDCIFCQLDRSILAATKLSYAFFDRFPVTRGHSLVIPKRHVRSVWEMTADEYNDAFSLARTVKDLEGFSSAPRLHDKIEGGDLKRGPITQWRNALTAIQGGKCFYDENHDMVGPEVDHVLPWTFVLEDRTWNLVLACRKCNNEKRDRLVGTHTLERLCVRNEKISNRRIHSDSRFFRHFEEWHSRGLSSHIRGLYDQAIADGFPKWKG